MDMQLFLGRDKNEKPLDTIVSDGGYTGIFRTIACVGDSLSSGEFESMNAAGERTYHDLYDYSWGQYLARMAGCEVRNFSQGGMTAQNYCEQFGPKNGFFDLARGGWAQAYIIALGVNDILNKNQEIGTVADICREDWTKNKQTFAGYYGQIVQRYKALEPDAKFFFMTIPSHGGGERQEKVEAHAALMYEMADFFENAYVVDFAKYAPVYDADFQRDMFLGGHMNPCGYMFTAKLMCSYLDYIIRHNMQDFRQVGLIGTGLIRREEEL